VTAFYQGVLERVRAVAGVTRAGLIRNLPLAQEIGDWGLDVEGFVESPGRNAKGDWQVVSDGAIEAFGERLIRGRTFTAADTAASMPSPSSTRRSRARTSPAAIPSAGDSHGIGLAPLADRRRARPG